MNIEEITPTQYAALLTGRIPDDLSAKLKGEIEKHRGALVEWAKNENGFVYFIAVVDLASGELDAQELDEYENSGTLLKF